MSSPFSPPNNSRYGRGMGHCLRLISGGLNCNTGYSTQTYMLCKKIPNDWATELGDLDEQNSRDLITRSVSEECPALRQLSISVTLWLARWRLKSPASRLFTQPFFLFRRRSKEQSKLRVTGLCAGNSPMIGEFPAQRASSTENVPFDAL